MNVAFKHPLPKTHSLDSIAEALLLPTGVDGVYARTAIFEQVVSGLGGLISRHREPDTEVLRFPPVMSRRQLEKSGYLKSFPHFLGCVSCLTGDEDHIRDSVERHDAGEDWTTGLAAADLVLSPAACYPVYPLAASRGHIPAGGLRFDVACDCFRREPSKMLDRLQSFRMREYVCIGTAEQVKDFRARWIKQGEAIAGQLGLAYRIEQASDPFFGRGGKLMAMSQVEQALKFELVVPIHSDETADRLHELQLSSRPFRRGVESEQRRRRDGGNRLRRFRRRSAGAGAVRHARRRVCAMAGARASRTDDLVHRHHPRRRMIQ